MAIWVNPFLKKLHFAHVHWVLEHVNEDFRTV